MGRAGAVLSWNGDLSSEARLLSADVLLASSDCLWNGGFSIHGATKAGAG